MHIQLIDQENMCCMPTFISSPSICNLLYNWNDINASILPLFVLVLELFWFIGDQIGEYKF